MKANHSKALFLSVFSAFVLIHAGLAVPPDDILAAAPGYSPTLNFKDTYSEKIVTFPAPRPEPGEPREPATHDVEPKSQKITAKIVANIKGFDFTEVADDMTVSVSIGAFAATRTLSESNEALKKGGFPAGGKKASYTLIGDFQRPDRPNGDPGESFQKKVGAVTFAWSDALLTVTVTCTDIVAAGVSEIAASTYIGLYQDTTTAVNKPSGKAPIPPDEISVRVTFGTATGSNLAVASGTSSTSFKKFGSDAAGTLEELFVQSVKLSGKAGTAAP